jgi:ABC transporter, ATP-binding protein
VILNVAHLNKAFGAKEIIKDASFLVNENEKVAVVGLNGAGKTTLLKILSGEDTADSGIVTISKDAKLGYLRQINNLDSELTIIEEMYTVIKPILDMEKKMLDLSEEMKSALENELEKYYSEYNTLTHNYELLDGYQARSNVNGILKGLGFNEDEFNKPISKLSGGQKTRVFLGKLLLSKPDIILLDEPTNHLDLSSIEWLEGYLLNYKGAIVIVSHDRYFLDKIVGKVIDIENGNVSTYIGNYSEFSHKKELKREADLKAYLNQQEEIKHQEEVIEKLRSYNREKSIKRAESREKLLDRIERVEKPVELKSDMGLRFEQTEESGMDVLRVEELSKSFGSKHLFSELNFELKRGEHVALMGDNGTGKTTILKIINGLLAPDTGDVVFGSRVQMAYYDQEHQVLNMQKTLFDEISDTFPTLSNTKIRNLLAAFLFMGDDVYKRIGDLSGGERGRVSLAKLMLSNANFLVLDEPTNHLDIMSKEILESAIRDFKGTVLYVSHDRYFINKTATRILDLRHSKLMNYIGNYDYYLEKKEDVERYAKAYSTNDPKENVAISSNKSDWKQNKEEQAKLRKQKNALAKCEKSISELEEKIIEIDNEFLKPENQTNALHLVELQKKKENYELELSELYEKWEKLAQELS